MVQALAQCASAACTRFPHETYYTFLEAVSAKVSTLLPYSIVCPMLRIRMVSGEEVASMAVDRLSNVRALKEQLNRFHDLPTRFRQRLLLDGNPVDDSAQLVSPMSCKLVLPSYCMPPRCMRKSWLLPPQMALQQRRCLCKLSCLTGNPKSYIAEL